MTKLERILAAIRREPVDRPPYAFWRHFPDVDRNPAALAQATLRFHERYGSDFLKVTPAAGYAVADWGCAEGDQVMPDGHRPCVRHAVTGPGDWKAIRPVRMESTEWASHLETVLRCVVDRRADCPTLPTVWSPLSLARRLAGDRLAYDLRENPQAVTGALEAITETTLAFMDACIREGAEGMFYSVAAASTDLHRPEEYARFGEPFDRQILEAVMPRTRLTVLHGHGRNLMWDRLTALPAHAVSWDDRGAGPGLGEIHARIRGAVMGGIDRQAIKEGRADEAKVQAWDAAARTGGLGLVIAAGDGLLPESSDAALVDLARTLGGKPMLGLIRPQ